METLAIHLCALRKNESPPPPNEQLTMNNEQLKPKTAMRRVKGTMDYKNNPIEEKSLRFAVRIVRFSKWLKFEHKEYELAGQIIRSGTSIGANVAEAQYAQSKKDFVSKMHIALKEAYETEYWLKLLTLSKIIQGNISQSLQDDLKEIIKLLIAIIKKSKQDEQEE